MKQLFIIFYSESSFLLFSETSNPGRVLPMLKVLESFEPFYSYLNLFEKAGD